MPLSRLPAYTVLQPGPSTANQIGYYAVQIDQVYEVISAGAFPDAGSLAGQLSAAVLIVRGGTALGTKAVQPATYTQLSGFNFGTSFGTLIERLMGDPNDPNQLVPLWGTVNPRFYNRMIRVFPSDWVLFLANDTVAGDGVTRAVTFEMLVIPFPGTQQVAD